MQPYCSLLVLALVAFASAALQSPSSSPKYKTLEIKEVANVTRVTFNHPPINLVDWELCSDLLDFLQSIQPGNRTTPPPKVVVFDSALPDFFLGHIDIKSIQQPITDEKTALTIKYVTIANLFNSITSTIFIAEINGRAFGAGQELSVQMDMRFAGPKASTGSFENALGLVAGGGGQLFLASLMNRGQALEYLLGTKAFDGPTGTRLGLFNNHYHSARDLRKAVDELSSKIGLFPATGLNETKAALSYRNPTAAALSDDVTNFYKLDQLEVQQRNVAEVIRRSKNQTHSPFELNLPDSTLELYGK